MGVRSVRAGAVGVVGVRPVGPAIRGVAGRIVRAVGSTGARTRGVAGVVRSVRGVVVRRCGDAVVGVGSGLVGTVTAVRIRGRVALVGVTVGAGPGCGGCAPRPGSRTAAGERRPGEAGAGAATAGRVGAGIDRGGSTRGSITGRPETSTAASTPPVSLNTASV
ncbi:hypothetical protein ACFQL0_10600 [Haloplanus litoreus]|uniref:hypothetical protein n=1 Tax=Haloplanus litoreus TaxID=767515 RepID=UPI003612CDC1